MKLNLMAGHVNSVETELISSSLCTGMRVFIQVMLHVFAAHVIVSSYGCMRYMGHWSVQ